MIARTTVFAALALGCALAAPAFAKDRPVAAEAVAKPAMNPSPPAAPPAESIGVAVYDGRDLVWSGSLRVGGPYGSASFSQSKSEYGLSCAAATTTSDRQSASSESLSFGISRYNWQQEPDRFTINLNWTRPVEPCQGEGNDSFGFNRVVTLPRGQSATIEGTGTMSVRLTRPQR